MEATNLSYSRYLNIFTARSNFNTFHIKIPQVTTKKRKCLFIFNWVRFNEFYINWSLNENRYCWWNFSLTNKIPRKPLPYVDEIFTRLISFWQYDENLKAFSCYWDKKLSKISYYRRSKIDLFAYFKENVLCLVPETIYSISISMHSTRNIRWWVTAETMNLIKLSFINLRRWVDIKEKFIEN